LQVEKSTKEPESSDNDAGNQPDSAYAKVEMTR